jgi:hypothetical protein
MYGQGRELEIGNATRTVLLALIDKDVLMTNAKVRALLTKVAANLGPHDYTAQVKGAIGIVLDDLLPRFPDGDD